MDADNHENLKTSITEPIMNKEIVGESHEIGILNKQGRIEWSKMIIDKSQELLLLKTTEGLEIKIKFEDVLSFTKDESKKNKGIQDENSEINNSIFSLI